MIDRLFFILVFTSLLSQPVKAQSMIGDFVNSAISVFRPLVEERRSHVREQSPFVRPMHDSQRDEKVLGASPHASLQDVPICNGDSRLCAFIACQAENLKNDQSIANLNLAAQVLADKKLRHSVGDNPEAINAVCMDSGMDSSRCGTFTRGFQMISKLINSIEEPIDKMKQRMPAAPPMESSVLNPALSLPDSSGMQTVPSPRMDQLPEPIVPSLDLQPLRPQQNLLQPPQLQQDDAVFRHPPVIRRLDDYDFSWATPRGMPSPRGMPALPPAPWASPFPSPSSSFPSPSSSSSSTSWSSSSQTAWGASRDDAPSRAFGSQTWSSKGGEAINPVQSESPLERNDLLASFTPIPPTAPPLAFPTVKSVLPSIEDLLLRPFRLDPALEKMLNPIKIEPILRFRRHADDFVRVVEHLARSPSKIDARVVEEENKRVKRAGGSEDYYDQADAEDNTRSSRPRGGSRGGKETTAPDYYDEVDTRRENRHRSSRPGRPKMQRNCFELLG